jgi:hypothetical protein
MGPTPEGQELAVGREGDGNHTSVLDEAPQGLVGGQVPDPDLTASRPPPRAGGQHLAVRGDRHTPDHIGISLRLLHPDVLRHSLHRIARTQQRESRCAAEHCENPQKERRDVQWRCDTTRG